MKKTVNKFYKLIFSAFLVCLMGQSLFAGVFNSKLTADEQKKLDNGEVLIKNITYQKNMCINKDYNSYCQEITEEIKKLSPKYLAEIIQVKPYKGNENLPEVLTKLLYTVSDYKDIPYYSERHQTYWNLYDSAEILKETVISSSATETSKEIEALFVMAPFDKVYETISLT